MKQLLSKPMAIGLMLIAFLGVGIPGYLVAKHPGDSKSMEMKMKNAYGGDQIAKSRAVTVNIRDYAFSPQYLTVRVGSKVTWTNHDSTDHTATARNGSFNTGVIKPKTSKSAVFTKVGIYPYYCEFHAFMTGVVRVVAK